MRRLPPLTAIEAFVQVARLGTVKAAAAELSLSPPALSRRVQGLEAFIGKPLFARRHQAMQLNADGERMLAMLSPALDGLSDAIEAMTSGSEVLRLRLGVLPLFASQQLFPRLGDLRTKHPELHLDIDTMGHGLQRLGDGLDAAIVLERHVDQTLYAKRLDRNIVYPIGARTLLDGPDPLVCPEQIARHTVLLHRDMTETFSSWRHAAGLGDLEPLAVDHFDSGPLMLEAAAQGLGIAFMHESHLLNARDDRLTKLFDIEVESPYSYWFVCRPKALQTKPVRWFQEWLIGALVSPNASAGGLP